MTTLATAAGTLLAAGAATGALWFTGQSLRATNAQLGLSQQTAVTDRFRLAAEQVASDKINVRLSGIYLLERLAKDAPADHATVFAVLAAFVRTQASITNCDTNQIEAPVDVQAALTVIGRRYNLLEQPEDRPDLSRTCLTGADLSVANLIDADLSHANLTNANLGDANLNGANLYGANLDGTTLFGTNLIKASLFGTNLSDADLQAANLIDADLSYANVNGAYLIDATLNGANLIDATLQGANLSHANLTNALLDGANLDGANLDGANLTKIRYGESTQWPKGFTPPPSR